jgi:hypothetical protein
VGGSAARSIPHPPALTPPLPREGGEGGGPRRHWGKEEDLWGQCGGAWGLGGSTEGGGEEGARDGEEASQPAGGEERAAAIVRDGGGVCEPAARSSEEAWRLRCRCG